jgi:hypothetical protein
MACLGEAIDYAPWSELGYLAMRQGGG